MNGCVPVRPHILQCQKSLPRPLWTETYCNVYSRKVAVIYKQTVTSIEDSHLASVTQTDLVYWTFIQTGRRSDPGFGSVLTVKKVQKAATTRVQRLRHLSYEDRLVHLGLPTLEERRLRGDLTETYKIMMGKEVVDQEQFFQCLSVNTAREDTV